MRKTFFIKEDAIKWENKVLHRVGVTSDEKWLNKSNGKPPIISHQCSESLKQFLSLKLKGKMRYMTSENVFIGWFEKVDPIIKE